MQPSGRQRRWRELVLASLLCCATGSTNAQPVSVAHPAGDYGNWSETEKWVWDRLKAGKVAVLDDRCADKKLDPAKNEIGEPHWLDRCRQITAHFLYDVLADARWKEVLPYQGILIDSAHIVGDFDLQNAELARQIVIANSRIDGGIALIRARTKSLIALQDTFVNGDFNASELNSESDLLLRFGTVFGRNVSLVGAKIAGQVGMTGVSVTGTLNANTLQTGDLFLRSDDNHPARFREVTLAGAKIAGNVDMTGITVTGPLNASGLQAHDVWMRSDPKHKARFQGINLQGAELAGQLGMTGISVSGLLYGYEMRVQQTVFMRSGHIGRGGNANDAASFAGGIKLMSTHINGDLDLRGAALTGVDLSETTVDGVLELGTSAGIMTTWNDTNGKPGSLILRNTRIGGLADEQAVWQLDSTPPRPRLGLDGLAISHLGGLMGGTAAEMRRRGMAWWDSWARLDPEYSPAPYTLVANAFAATGDRDAANEIRFLGRVRERQGMTRWRPWLGAMALEYVAGFGIGYHTFRVLYWIAAFTVAGAALLWFAVPAAHQGHRGRLWCLGASLSRLLPIVEINKEFTEFFNDPDRTRLKGGAAIAFAVLGVVGWILGGILIAALSGLTEHT